MTMTFTRSERQHFKALRQELINAHLYVRSATNRATDTVALLVDRVGPEDAKRIVALMISCKGDWDARISRANRKWAEEIEPFADEIATACMLFYCDDIHPSHMDMIADCLRKEETA